jgi:hypothetical protein
MAEVEREAAAAAGKSHDGRLLKVCGRQHILSVLSLPSTF